MFLPASSPAASQHALLTIIALPSLYCGAPDEGNQFTTKEGQQRAHPHGSDSSHHIPLHSEAAAPTERWKWLTEVSAMSPVERQRRKSVSDVEDEVHALDQRPLSPL